MARTARAWDGECESWGWAHVRNSEPVNSLVLNLILPEQGDRKIEVLIPKDEALRLAWFISRDRDA